MLLLTFAARTPRLAQQARGLARLYTYRSFSSCYTSGSEWRWSATSATATAAAAALLAGACTLHMLPVAHGEAAYDPPSSLEERRRQFKQWLAANNADFEAAEVKCSQDPGAGLGLFATPVLRQHMTHRWLGRRVGAMLLPGASNQTVPVASVPLDLALTARAAQADPLLGAHYSELLDLGVIDERNTVILMLMIERLRGRASRYAPYINMLPDRFNTPLWFDEEQQQQLAGTTLAAAAAAQQAALASTWQRLQPAAVVMLQQAGVSVEPTLEDFKWASSVFWSRGLGLPVTIVQQQQQQQQNQQGTPAIAGDVAVERLGFEVWEGLVPGIDFANHSQEARCWWEVVQQQQQQQQQEQYKPQQQQQQQQQEDGDDSSGGDNAMSQVSSVVAAAAAAPANRTGQVVRLMTNRACCPKSGEELCISYGDKGNEELLLLYGFAQPANPNERLMLLCPVPPLEDWDDTFSARMQLLQARGLKPQLFLPASHLINCQTGAASRKGSRSGSRSVIPAEARDVITAFVMQPKELFALLQDLQQQQQQQQGGDRVENGSSLTAAKAATATAAAAADEATIDDSGDRGLAAEAAAASDAVQARIEHLGLDMAVLTTFVRLLELKMIQQEGDDGTGPLEDDIRLLSEEHVRGVASVTDRNAVVNSNSSSDDSDEVVGLPGWLLSCVLYRAGQKRLVRDYLRAARQELQETLSELKALMEVTGQFSD